MRGMSFGQATMCSLSLFPRVPSIDCFAELAPMLQIVIVYRMTVPMIEASKPEMSRYHRLRHGQQAPIATSQVIDVSVI